MADTINGVPIGDLPGIDSVPDNSMLVVEFLGKAYHMPGAVLRQMIQDILDSMGDSVDDVTEARLTAAIETVLASGKYNGVSPIVEVTKQEDETFVLHVVDAFGIKDYPIKVKLPDLSVNGSNVMVELSGDDTKGYTVLLDGEVVTGDTLDKLVKEGANIIGIAKSDMSFQMAVGSYTIPADTIFEYGNAIVSGNTGVGGVGSAHSFEFCVRIEDHDFAVAYQNETWVGMSHPAHLTFLLSENDGDPVVLYNGEPVESSYLFFLLFQAKNQLRPVFCYQDGMKFYLEDGSGTAITPPWRTPFSLLLNAENEYYFYAEQDGYNFSLIVQGMLGYTSVAEKNTPYKTAESKGDDLEVADGKMFLLSAGERINDGVPLPAGGGDGTGGGVTAPVNGFFTLSVDEDGNLWAHSAENGTTPEFEYDSETGNLYFLTEE